MAEVFGIVASAIAIAELGIRLERALDHVRTCYDSIYPSHDICHPFGTR